MGMRGRSFDEVFAESAAAHAGEIPRPTDAQLEQWLLTPQVVTARSSDGAVHVHGNRYWVPELARALAGKPANRRRVVVRYDATDLTRPPVVEELDGRLIARAELRTAAPVLDADSAKQIERERKRAAKLDREQLRDSSQPVRPRAGRDGRRGCRLRAGAAGAARLGEGHRGRVRTRDRPELGRAARVQGGCPDPGGREGRGRGIAVTNERKCSALLDGLLAEAREAEDFQALYEAEEGEPWPGEAMEDLLAVPPAFYLGMAFLAERVRKRIESFQGELKEHSNGN